MSSIAAGCGGWLGFGLRINDMSCSAAAARGLRVVVFLTADFLVAAAFRVVAFFAAVFLVVFFAMFFSPYAASAAKLNVEPLVRATATQWEFSLPLSYFNACGSGTGGENCDNHNYAAVHASLRLFCKGCC
jgi:hypothetical protein